MILGSIITGFSKPIKPEHLQFLKEAILPLHQPDWLGHYHPQLSYCMMQYVQKDPITGRDIIRTLVKKWPWRNSAKQVCWCAAAVCCLFLLLSGLLLSLPPRSLPLFNPLFTPPPPPPPLPPSLPFPSL